MRWKRHCSQRIIGAALGFASVLGAGGAWGQTEQAAVTLDTIEVGAAAESGEGPVQGYRAERTRSGTKTDTPIRDIPQSIAVVPRAVIEDVEATRVEQVFDYAGGVGRQNNFGGLTMFEYSIRGFATSEFFKNGFSVNRGYAAYPDAVNVERVEVLKGPAGALFGRGDPGGAINIVTKRPQAERAFEAGVSYGSFNRQRATVDVTGPLDADGTLLYRVTGALESAESFRDFVELKRAFLAPSILWKTPSGGTLRIDAEIMRNTQTFDRGVVAINNRLGRLPISRFLGEPDDRIKNNNDGLTITLDQPLNDAWTLRLATSARRGDLAGPAAESWRLLGDNRTLQRRHRVRDYRWQDGIVQGEITGVFHTGAFKHTLLIGAEYEESRRREILNRSANGMTIDIFNPVYGQPRAPLTVFSDSTTRVNAHALFIQDQIDVTSKLKFIAGGRYDRFDQSVTDNLNGNVQDSAFGAFSPRAGALYQLTPEIGLFANVARSFRPNAGLSRTGASFDPERGLGYEAGVKIDLFDQRLSVTAAAFHVTKDNVLTADPHPEGAGFSIAAGRARSRGFDLSFAGQITPEWRVIGGYAFVDAEVVRDNTLAPGTLLLNVPRHSAGALAVHEFLYGALKGLGVGAGVTYVGGRPGDGAGTGFRLPAYATVDLLASYQLTQNVRLKVNVHNLLDREYYERSFDNRWIMPGAPRSITGSLTVKF